MDPRPTEQQVQLGRTLERLIEREYPFEQRRRSLPEGGFSRRRWQLLCDIGLPALLVPESHGGLQAPLGDVLYAMQCLGPAMPPEPVLASCVLAPWLLARAGGDAAAQWLPRLAEGAVGSVAMFEPGSGFDHARLRCRARRDAGHWVLDGAKALVPQGEDAELLLVWARDEHDAPAWFALPADTPGIGLRGYALLDGQRAAELSLHDVRVAQQARLPGDAAQLADELRDLWLAALCSDAVGVLQATLDATVEYLGTRQQFGQPLARLQALQHRASAMWIDVEQARSMAWLAAARFESEPAPRRAALLAAAKARVGRACRDVAQQAVQLHGGIGLSDELRVSHWFKRLSLLELWLGDSRAQLQRYIDLSAALPA